MQLHRKDYMPRYMQRKEHPGMQQTRDLDYLEMLDREDHKATAKSGGSLVQLAAPVVQRQALQGVVQREIDPRFEGEIIPGGLVRLKVNATLWHMARALRAHGLNLDSRDLMDYYGVSNLSDLRAGQSLRIPLFDKDTGFLRLQHGGSGVARREILNELGRYYGYEFVGGEIRRRSPGRVYAAHDSLGRLTFLAAAFDEFNRYLVLEPYTIANRDRGNPGETSRIQNQRLRALFGEGATGIGGEFDRGATEGFLAGISHGMLAWLAGLTNISDNARVNEENAAREAEALQASIEAQLEGKSDAAILGFLKSHSPAFVFGQILPLFLFARLSLRGGRAAARRLQGEVGTYEFLRGAPRKGYQAHHLNQDAAYKSVIPTKAGISVRLQGDAIRDVGSQHYRFHQSMERFWTQFRRGGARYGNQPSNREYSEALDKALREAGMNSSEASYLVGVARNNRAQFGLRETEPVPDIPNRLNQMRPEIP